MSTTAAQRTVSSLRHRHRVRVAVTAVAASGVLILAGCGSNSSQDEPANAVGAAQEQESTEESEQDTLAEWGSTVSSDWDDLSQAFSDIADSSNDDEMTAACQDGLDAAVALQQAPPYPRNPKLWNSMLDHVSSGFALCVSGDLTAANSQMALGVAELKQLSTDMDEYTS
ncbi:hypothetical protein ACFYWS_26000 [Streptomyces sp. NPDC002795]|uniref:hypothetical protein n=1 Tax=Streptomyces sp. NPDC002795 TaxID=3364665 RepID=UPI0036A0BDD1